MKKKIYLMRPFVGEEELEAVKKVFESNYLTEEATLARRNKKYINKFTTSIYMVVIYNAKG